MAVEVLRGKPPSESAEALLSAMVKALRNAGETVSETRQYVGKSEWLLLFGAGAAVHNEARHRHRRNGGKAWLFDLGYFGRKKIVGYMRTSINDDHPQKWLDRTEPEPSRFDAHKISLREDANAKGHIILVGLGRKSRIYLNAQDWESLRLRALRARFPGREIIYRPKPGSPILKLNCKVDAESPIDSLLRGASLISCHHSNVAVDAIVAGIPFECDDGAAMYLQDKPFTAENRLDFLRRLCWWQWKSAESAQAWQFIKGIA